MLLIDEIDRADDEFEAFLFELLAESTVTIPELGTVDGRAPADRRADVEPHPRPPRRPQAALPVPLDRLPAAAHAPSRSSAGASRPPGAPLVEQVGGAVGRLRTLDVQKAPGIAEAIAWVAALDVLGIERADADDARR